MNKMTLNDKERAILTAYDLALDLSIPKARKLLHLHEHTIRYALNRLQEREIITPRVFLNIYPLGYQEYAIYFSLAASSREKREEFLLSLKQSERISWLTELGADFQYGMSICARGFREVVSFLDDLSNRFPKVLFEKSLSVRISLTLFPRKYLSPKRSAVHNKQPFVFGDCERQIEIDEKDKQLLQAVEKSPTKSTRELARGLGLAHTTLDSRIKRLTHDGVIVGFTYELNLQKIGMQQFTFLVFSKGLDQRLSKKLFEFCKEQINITHFIRCLGSWDYEIGLEVEQGEDVIAIVQELYTHFGPELQTVKVLPVLRRLKLKNYPFGAELLKQGLFGEKMGLGK